MRTAANQIHFGPLDGLRGLAAQTVLVAHAFCFAYPERLAGPGGDLRSWIARLAVIAFFALSGFVIAHSIARQAGRDGRFDAADYAIRRAARILPPYFLIWAILLALALGAAAWGGLKSYDGGALPPYEAGPAAWLRALFFLNRMQDAVTIIDPPLWSLRIEVGLYVLAALAGLAWFAAGTARAACSLLFAGLLAGMCWRLSYAAPAAFVFASGAAAALLLPRIPTAFRAKIWLWAALALGALPFLAPALVADIDNSALSTAHQCLFGLLFAVGLIGVALVPPSGSRAAALVRASGGWSYTLYILHWPALLLLNSLLGLRGWPALLAYFLLVNAASVALARAAERPAMFAELLRSAFRGDWLRPAAVLPARPDRERS